jgi:RNA polymerase sigma-70 factor (ECF subfamily)
LPSPAALALTVALAQSGDRRALDRLLRDHQWALLRHARAILHEEEAALDAVQASLMLIARRLGSLRDARWFRPWAYRITTREAVRLAKSRGRERQLFEEEPADVTDTAVREDEADELLRACADGIDRLPGASRLVLSLHYREGLTLVEIAEALEVPLGTVKSRLAYGLARLRDWVVPA